MGSANANTRIYKRSRFVTKLPVNYLYSPTHYWVDRQPDGICRVGLTQFATRMLGEMVDYAFDTPVGAAIAPGQILGWIEGFKAIADLYSVVEGQFGTVNPALTEKIILINRAPYHEGWLFSAHGAPDAKCMDVEAYCQHLDKMIDFMNQKKS